MSALELYAKRLTETQGTEHMHALETLRSYIRLTTEADMVRYISMITDQAILRVLLEAGMRGAAHRVLILRMNDLMKQQQGGAP